MINLSEIEQSIIKDTYSLQETIERRIVRALQTRISNSCGKSSELMYFRQEIISSCRMVMTPKELYKHNARNLSSHTCSDNSM